MMYLAKIFQWSKSLHRLSLLAMVGLSLVMGLTGTWLRFPMTASGVIDLDLALLRFLHYQFSPWFSIIIGIMTTSGLYMYWYPGTPSG